MPEPLSLMPGPASTESRWAPTTTVRSARPVGVSARTLDDSVVMTRACTATRTLTVASRLDHAEKLLADGEGGADHRQRHLGRIERPEDSADPIVARIRIPLVEDDDGSRARGLCVRRLLAEGAGAALDQCDRSSRKAVEVGCRAAARSATRRRDHDPACRNEAGGDIIATGVVHRRELAVLQIRPRRRARPLEDRRRRLFEAIEDEVLDGHEITGSPHLVCDVSDGLGVAQASVDAGRMAELSNARLSELLEVRQVAVDVRDRHGRPQLR